MGSVASLMTGKVSVTQGKSFLYRSLYDKFIGSKDIKNFEDFHVAFLQIINTINSVVPGRHYDVPEYGEIEEVYKKWNEAIEENKAKVFEEFIRDNVKMRSVDRSMILTGLAAPPAAMVAKRAGESLPQLKIIKVVPDLLFVPSATLLSLVGCKLATTLNRVS
ncbi:hypothetical protein QN277_023600 [Acacia crassicarpa]|uniref:Calcium ion-binding protein n=1 Tax=Acacia crassicarpa TaxID=499986 RepID=A0AAE1JET7_9FABA|nr:hypothetical protein QN277_023600 [Acacia crassicarpa]